MYEYRLLQDYLCNSHLYSLPLPPHPPTPPSTTTTSPLPPPPPNNTHTHGCKEGWRMAELICGAYDLKLNAPTVLGNYQGCDFMPKYWGLLRCYFNQFLSFFVPSGMGKRAGFLSFTNLVSPHMLAVNLQISQ